MPCRSDERDSAKSFLASAIQKGGLGRALYISGMPGTGKTATIRQVMRELRAARDRKELPHFQVSREHFQALSPVCKLNTNELFDIGFRNQCLETIIAASGIQCALGSIDRAIRVGPAGSSQTGGTIFNCFLAPSLYRSCH